MPFELAKAAWLQYLEKKMYYFDVLSLEAQHALLKRRFSPATSVVDECQDDSDDDDEDWELKGAVVSDDVKNVGAKRCQRDLQRSCRAEKFKVRGTVAKAFEIASELINIDVAADAGPSTELVCTMDASAIALRKSKNTLNDLALLQRKH